VAREGELPALRFARRYAESNEAPNADAWAALNEACDAKMVEDLVSYIRDIYFSNLAGNTLNHLRAQWANRRHRLRDLCSN